MNEDQKPKPDQKAKVKDLIDKAANADDSNDALKFSQAACNIAHALQSINEV